MDGYEVGAADLSVRIREEVILRLLSWVKEVVVVVGKMDVSS